MSVALSIPDDVRLDVGAVTDLVRDQAYEINETAAFMFATIGASSDSDELSAALCEAYGIEPDLAHAAVREFVDTFNPLGLVNARPPTLWGAARRTTPAAAAVAVVARLLPGGARRPTTRRTPLPEGRPRRALVVAGRALLPAALKSTALVTLGLLLLLALIQVAPPDDALAIALAIGGATGGGMWCHELAHLACLGGTRASALVSGLTPAIAHHPDVSTRRAVWATVAGPLSGGVLAVPTLAVAAALDSVPLTLAGLMLASQLLGLTMVSGDGRHLAHLLAAPDRR